MTTLTLTLTHTALGRAVRWSPLPVCGSLGTYVLMLMLRTKVELLSSTEGMTLVILAR